MATSTLIKKEDDKANRKVGLRLWIAFIVIGIAGQIAWAIENMYINVFIFYLNAQSYSLYISITTAASAITAVITTLLIGSLSDKIGKKKIFITAGYILWGISTAAFGFIKINSIEALFGVTSVVAGLYASIFVITLDCIMTFFGSSANDASFNAYVTQNTNKSNRGRVEGVLATLPLLATIFAVLLNGQTDSNWDIFFYIVGGFTTLIGIMAIFILPKEKVVKKSTSFLYSLTYGFRKENIKNNKNLYILYIIFLLYCIAGNVFMPYLLIYIGNNLNINGLEFELSFGAVLIFGAILSILIGFLMDKFGKKKILIPAILLYSLGLLLMFFVGDDNLAIFIVFATVMMAGYMTENSCINANIRDFTPKGEEGSYQGIRMIFQVAIPMSTGPFIGMALINNLSTKYYVDDYGVQTLLPNEYLFLVAFIIALLALIPAIIFLKSSKKYVENNGILYDKSIDFTKIKVPLEETPNPQFSRANVMVLNGVWFYEISKNKEIPAVFTKNIVVPYAIESQLSGVNLTLKPDEYLFYKKVVTFDSAFNKGKLFLHFDGVDQICEVFINGVLKTIHVSGYTGFFVDISDIVADSFEIVLRVKDYSDSSFYAFGKQRINRGGIWYTTSSGIYKTVWLESAPPQYIKNIYFRPFVNESSVEVRVLTSTSEDCEIEFDGKTYTLQNERPTIIKIDKPSFWSCESPHLYEATLKFKDDVVKTYFGLRTVEIKKDKNEISKVYLNNKEVFLNGILDQGYYYEGNLTPKSDEDYIKDISNIKNLGFNTIRMHVKIESPRFYYHCDKIGILVIQDFPNGGTYYNKLLISLPALFDIKIKDDKYKLFSRESASNRDAFISNTKEMVMSLFNHPSIIVYTIFNEGWGQFDSAHVYKELLETDSSRLYDVNSGWYDQGVGNFVSKHIYFKKIALKSEKSSRALLLSEFGGYSLYIKENFYGKRPFGYKKFKNGELLTTAYKNLYESQIIPSIKRGLAGCIYTQLNDVEDEVNGLFTFDRNILKIDEKTIKDINQKIRDLVK